MFSLGAHLALLLGLALSQPPATPPAPVPPEPFVVALTPAPRPAPAPGPAASAAESSPPAKSDPPPPTRIVARPAPASLDVPPLPAGETESPRADVGLTAAELASAVGAGSGGAGGGGGGGGGGRCDMAALLQKALREDPDVRAAVARVHQADGPAPILLWRGDWIRNFGEDGAGLARVRQAMIMEIGFAPEACRSAPMRGFVLISLNDAPGSAQLALGSTEWRWSDLLTPRGFQR
ncbi:MAG: hypothetical protein ACK41C_08630 [Phenylobacterium sp.]|uniref:hypothetical protein n=1 Tax=Phenylobacterium sp. TaxID=1871053 RepID=UPI003918A993